jgi:hypothetical protein
MKNNVRLNQLNEGTVSTIRPGPAKNKQWKFVNIQLYNSVKNKEIHV